MGADAAGVPPWCWPWWVGWVAVDRCPTDSSVDFSIKLHILRHFWLSYTFPYLREVQFLCDNQIFWELMCTRRRIWWFYIAAICSVIVCEVKSIEIVTALSNHKELRLICLNSCCLEKDSITVLASLLQDPKSKFYHAVVGCLAQILSRDSFVIMRIHQQAPHWPSQHSFK